MKSAIVRIEKHINGYWATVLPYVYKDRFPVFFHYNTDYFEQVQEAGWEARAFCRWKKLKIRKIIRKYKYREHR